MDESSIYLWTALNMLPGTILWIVGLVMATRIRRRYPVRSRLAVTGFSVLLITGPIFTVISFIVSRSLIRDVATYGDYGIILRIIGFANTIANVIGYSFLLAALFSRRANAARPEMELDDAGEVSDWNRSVET